MKKKKETAAEFMARLEADPEFTARRTARDEEFRRRDEELARAERPLIEALRKAGVEVESVWDLVNRGGPTPPGIAPLLLEHLRRPYPDVIRDGIARSLAGADADFARPELIEMFRREPEDSQTRQGLAVAISNTTNQHVPELVDEIIAMLDDPSLGEDRILLMDVLRRSRLPQAREALERFARDPVLHQAAEQILKLIARRKKRSTGS